MENSDIGCAISLLKMLGFTVALVEWGQPNVHYAPGPVALSNMLECRCLADRGLAGISRYSRGIHVYRSPVAQMTTDKERAS